MGTFNDPCKRKLLPAEFLQVLLLLRRCVIRIPRALRRQCCGAGVVERTPATPMGGESVVLLYDLAIKMTYVLYDY